MGLETKMGLRTPASAAVIAVRPGARRGAHSSGAGAWLGTLTANGVVLLCRAVTGVLCARLLGVAGRGALASLRLWPDLFAHVGSLSLNEAVTYRTARAAAGASRVRVTALWVSLLLAACVVALGVVALPFLLGPSRTEGAGPARLYLLALVPAHFLLAILLASDLGEERFSRYNAIRVLPFLVFALALVAFGLAGSVTVATALASSVAGTLMAAVLRLRIWWTEGHTRPSWTEARHLLRYGLRFHGASVVATLGAHVDRLVVIVLWSDTVVGLYAVAWTVATTGLALLTRSFHTVLFPRVAREARSDVQARLLADALRRSMFVLSLGLVLLIAATPWIVPLLFGRDFRPARETTAVMLLAYLPCGLRQIGVRALRGLGHGTPGTVAETVAVLGFITAAWPCGRWLGLPGIAVALGLGNLAALAYLSRALRRQVGLRLRDWWGLGPRTWREACSSTRTFLRMLGKRIRRGEGRDA